jgi:Uma2 family endonuclease
MLMAYATEPWTLDQLHRLPDDGNRYELLDGELFVTPPPSPSHELLASRLRSVLEPYVRAQRLGDLFGPRAVVRMLGAEVEPDLMLRPGVTGAFETWDKMPVPTLVVEVLSRTTSRRDLVQKRAYYQRIGVQEYWIVDGASRSICVVGKGDDMVTATVLRWQPEGATDELVIDVEALFHSVLG